MKRSAARCARDPVAAVEHETDVTAARPRPRRSRLSAPAEAPPTRVNLTGVQLQSTEPAPSNEDALAVPTAE